MCYLRNFAPIQKSPLYKQPQVTDEACESQKFNAPFDNLNRCFNFLQNKGDSGISNFGSQILNNLIKLAQNNSKAIENIASKIDQNETLLDSMDEEGHSRKNGNLPSECLWDTEDSTLEEGACYKTQQFLTKKLFGENKEYKYKLQLDGGFPEQVFKERNFNFNVKLTDMKGNKIRNSNIIHLCLGVCDVNGEWVTETKSKQTLIKGKTQSELYHGQASYTKIFSRDVSRFYPEGKLNIVVYPKQSALKYCQGSNSLEESVNFQEIEPMIVKDLTIKAKKKQ